MKRMALLSSAVGCALLPLGAYAQSAPEAADPLDGLLFGAPETPPAQYTPSPSSPPDQADGQTLESIEVDPIREEAPPPAVADKPRSRLVEEIVVTAQKREEALQDVPISIQAFSGSNLDARGVTDATALQRITPGLTITQSVGFTLIYLRGVGSDAFLLGDPSVAYYIDNIYFPFSQGLAQEFGAIDRVEVLKGPQGTLFGRNAVGGAINVHTKAPDFEEAYVTIDSEVGNYNTLKNRVHVSVPLTDTLATSISAFYNEQDFYQEGLVNVTPFSAGNALSPIRSKAGRIKLRWAPVDAVDATIAGLKYRSDGAGTLFQLNAFPSPLARTLGVQAQDGYDGTLDEPVDQYIDNTVVYGDVKVYLPWFDLRLLGSDQQIDTGAAYDYDGSPRQLVSFDGPQLFADVQSAELQILSNEAGPDWLEWIVGSYYFQSKSGYEGGLRQKVSAVNTLTGALLDLLPLEQLPDFLSGAIPTGNVFAFGKLGTRSIAYFAQGTIDFADWISLTLGGRYQEEERYIIEAYNAAENADGSAGPAIFPLDPDSNLLSTTTNSFSPKASLNFTFGDASLLYFSVQEATKSGTYNPLKLLRRVDYVAPEETTAYEIGFKTTLFDQSVSFSTAAFFYDIRNLHVQYVSLLNGGVVTYETANAAEVKGIDFDMTAVLFPSVVDDLVLTLSGAWIDARFTDFENGSGFSQQSGLFSVNNDFTDNRISRSPEYTANATLSKTWAIPGGPLEIAADYYYNSGFYFTAQNVSSAEQTAYSLVGARVSYLYDRWNLRITAFGSNVLDEKYQIGVLQADFGTNVSYGAPVTYGLRLSWEYGS
jgi:iron complex outermembrane receptor protein